MEVVDNKVYMFFLVSGIKILSQLAEIKDDVYILEQPLELFTQVEEGTGRMRVGCLDFTPEAKDRGYIPLNKMVVATHYELKDAAFKKQYESSIQRIKANDAGIVLPKGVNING